MVTISITGPAFEELLSRILTGFDFKLLRERYFTKETLEKMLSTLYDYCRTENYGTRVNGFKALCLYYGIVIPGINDSECRIGYSDIAKELNIRVSKVGPIIDSSLVYFIGSHSAERLISFIEEQNFDITKGHKLTNVKKIVFQQELTEV
jgi:hypothetical protein